MKNVNFPTTIIDGFFENPDQIREYGLNEISKHQIRDETYPGVRSRYLNDINPDLFNSICEKMLRLFFNYREPIRWNAMMQFQLINKNYGSGWVHRDSLGIATSIIYLTPNAKNIGTSIYENKYPFAEKAFHDQIEFKRNCFINGGSDEEMRNKVNSNFNEVINVQGLYNRALFFDSHLLHAAHDFIGDDINSGRLTIVTLFKSIQFEDQLHPIPRMHISTNYTI